MERALLNNALKGDTTAQIFWLKNRRPDLWRDRGMRDTGNIDDGVEVINDAPQYQDI